jgi:hypothetical protein
MSNQTETSLDLGIIFITLGLALLTASGTRGPSIAQKPEVAGNRALQELLAEYIWEIMTPGKTPGEIKGDGDPGGALRSKNSG